MVTPTEDNLKELPRFFDMPGQFSLSGRLDGDTEGRLDYDETELIVWLRDTYAVENIGRGEFDDFHTLSITVPDPSEENSDEWPEVTFYLPKGFIGFEAAKPRFVLAFCRAFLHRFPQTRQLYTTWDWLGANHFNPDLPDDEALMQMLLFDDDLSRDIGFEIYAPGVDI